MVLVVLITNASSNTSNKLAQLHSLISTLGAGTHKNEQSAGTSANSVESASAVHRGSTFHGL